MLSSNKLNQLEESIKVKLNVNIDVPNIFEDETEIKSKVVTKRDKSPFGRQFELISQTLI